jgi:heme A synthase
MASAASGDFLGHPKGLYVCFFTEMWERFSFYGMKALLLLYLLKYHLFGDDAGYDLLGAYGGLVYAVPVIGGMVADRWASVICKATPSRRTRPSCARKSARCRVKPRSIWGESAASRWSGS